MKEEQHQPASSLGLNERKKKKRKIWIWQNNNIPHSHQQVGYANRTNGTQTGKNEKVSVYFAEH